MAYCSSCGSSSCGCGTKTYNICDPCNTNTGCPFQLDSACVIYHKNNSETSELTNLGISNGATLELILETIDANLEGLNVLDWSLECLRADFTINSLQQFAESVDTRLCELSTDIEDLALSAAVPLVANDSATIDFTTSGTLGHTLTGSVKVSANANNTLTAVADGLYAAPQTLSVDFDAHTLTISNGNTVDLTNLFGDNPSLGNLSADPGPVEDGQYWYNTTSNLLKIQVDGGTVLTITTT